MEKKVPITEYDRIVSRMEELADAEPGSAEAEELKKITRLVISVELGQLVHASYKSRAYSTPSVANK